ncbi:MAG: circularly permuted type 2 ATP-grasp protein, partial [Gammaproteobacteria bacterium]|nr:circularly permuted type 2 ATP-grasp protein [Gammaproteobacteria bacterium]
MEIDWNSYDPGELYDEMISSPGHPRRAARAIAAYLQKLTAKQLGRRQNAAELAIAEMGVTFTVYSEGTNIDRTWPFDIIPRIIPQTEWSHIEEGLEQRMTALNMFIHDLYNDQKIIKDGIVPKKLVTGSKSFLPQCIGA